METGSEEKSLPVSNISDRIVVFGNVSTISVSNILGYIRTLIFTILVDQHAEKVGNSLITCQNLSHFHAGCSFTVRLSVHPPSANSLRMIKMRST